MSEPAPAPMMVFHVPEDSEWLQAYGRMNVVHAHLDHILRMTIKTLTGVTVGEALGATERENSSVLRERIKKLARQRLGEGAVLVRLQALIERCKRATDQRNEWVHNIVASDWLGTEPQMYRPGLKVGPLPTVAELDALTDQIKALYNELNFARLHDHLAQAVEGSSPAKPSRD